MALAIAAQDVCLAAPAPPLEYAVKATFLYKFIPFVEWPAAAFETPASPLTICVLGNDAVAALLDEAVANQRIEQRALVARHLNTVSRDSGCHVLYIAGSSEQSPDQALAAIRGAPVLTVTDSARIPAPAGIISFVVQENRVGFDIDDATAALNMLTINSKLLSLARRVRTRP
jgi:hypothetical protein